MNWIASSILFASLLVLAASKPQQASCKDGDSWKDECGNTCWCNRGNAICTQAGCTPKRQARSTDLLGAPTCKDGDTWMDDCNQCFCTNGHPACTQKACLSVGHPRPTRSAETLEEPACKGDTWMEDCNQCWCDNGHPACTMMGCLPKTTTLTRPVRSTDQCVPLTAWKKGFIYCTCSLSGVETCEHLLNRAKRETETSTIEDVLKHQVVLHQDCTEGTVWQTNCVDCKCTTDGPSCAAIPDCVPQPITPRKTTCEGDERWMDDCNNCWCDQDRPVCTKKACRSHPHYALVIPNQEETQEHKSKRDTTKKCVPGKVWIQMTDNDEGCAKFTCQADGTATSVPHFTREMCPSEPEYIKVIEDSEPQHHVSKRKAECVPGKVWIQMTDNDEGCAKFTCQPDGTATSVPHFTREMCPSEPEYIKEIEDLHPQHHVSRRNAGCKPGEKWMEDCNECTCNNEGKGSCTRILCESDKPAEIPWLLASETQTQDQRKKRAAKCVPGKVWIQMTDNDEGCAKFTCQPDGTATSVPHFTREMCPSEPEYIKEIEDLHPQHHVSRRNAGNENERSSRNRRAPPADCKPGQSYFDGCNTCTCLESGPPACTYKICPPNAQIQTVNFAQLPQSSVPNFQHNY